MGGHMHNYMRMYWCKQLILWVADPREAFDLAVSLNNKYSLDGRDENGYMGIAWCFGHHDREFPERPLFGRIRPMTRKGIESKFNMAKYKQLVQQKCRAAIKREPRVAQLLASAAVGGANGTSSLLWFRFSQSNVAHAEPPNTSSTEDHDPETSSKHSGRSTTNTSGAAVEETKPPEVKLPEVRKDQAIKEHGLHRFFKTSTKAACSGEVVPNAKRQRCSSEGIMTID